MRESQRRRHKDVGLVDRVIELDEVWRKAKYVTDMTKQEFNTLNKEIATKRKAKEDTAELQARSKELKAQVVAAEEAEKAATEARDAAIVPIGNLVHGSVPVEKDEDHNTVVRTHGEPRQDGKFNHVDLVQMLGIVNLEKGTEVAGGRGYYLLGAGTLLNQALINCAMQFLYKREYTPVQTPFFMQQDIMGECAQLGDFDEQLYKVTGEGADKYLIATSE